MATDATIERPDIDTNGDRPTDAATAMEDQANSPHDLLERITPDGLAIAVNDGYKKFGWWRKRRKDAYLRFAGPDHGEETDDYGDAVGDGTDFKPVNLTAQQVRTLLPHVAFAHPAADVTALAADYEFHAEMRRAALDQDAERLNLTDKYQDRAVDAILSGISVVRVGIRAGRDLLKVDDSDVDPGELYEECVDGDDWCIDPTARRFSERKWDAVRHRVNKHEAITWRIYGRDEEEFDENGWRHPMLATRDEATEILKNAVPASRGDSGDEDRVSAISGTADSTGADGDSVLNDDIELWDVILYFRGEIWQATILSTASSGTGGTAEAPQNKFLMFERYSGPGDGPLCYLTFVPMPNNVLPLALDTMQRQLAKVADLLASKIVRQILATKNVNIYRPDQQDEAMQVMTAPEEAWIPGDPTAFKSITSGSLSPEALSAMQLFEKWWNDQTGALSTVAGQQDTGKTATAFAGLMARAMGWMQFLQSRMEKFATDCLQRRAWFRFSDPFFEAVLPYRLPNGRMIDVKYDREMMSGSYIQFRWRVRAYSMQVQEPTQRAQTIIQLFTGPLPRIVDFCAAAGIDPKPIIRTLSRLLNLPELDQMIPDIVKMQQRAAIDQITAPTAPQPTGAVPAGGGWRAPGGGAGRPPMQPGMVGGGGGMQQRPAASGQRPMARQPAA